VKTKLLFYIGFSIILLAAVFSYNAVDNSLTEEDMQYIPKFLVGIESLPEKYKFKDEIEYIAAVQKSVIEIAPHLGGLPFGQKREPKELFVAKRGLCFDRSRVIEKILRYSGFKTRHINVYAKKGTESALKTLLTPGVPSHAITEVLTSRSWLVVDSNATWLGLNKNDQPIPLENLWFMLENLKSVDWKSEPPSFIYNEPFTFVYGLYSRHGKFYPPFNFVPDLNMSEFVENFF
jgi:hypothetical protein